MYHGERFNSISHLVGAGLALAGAIVLVTLAARLGDPWKIVSFSIYGAMLVALYVFSTIYHSVRGRAKNILRKLDHCAIYLLIAGTYTPFALVSLRGTWGWWLLGIVWSLALFGIVQELMLGKRTRVLSLVLYVLMGWLADLISRKYVMILIYLIVGCVIPLLLVPDFPGRIYIFAVIFGIGLGGDYMIIPLMAGDLFGVRALGRTMGIILVADGVAESLFPMLLGVLYNDATKSYSVGFTVLICVALAGAVIISFLPRKMQNSVA